MRPHLQAGVAVYNAGRYHAAHDAWEDHWLDLEAGTEDERFLHGLIQFTAAVHHATNGNWSGATGLAESAGEYLSELPAEYRSVNVADGREYLASLARDPEVIERRQPLALTHEGTAIGPADLDLDATAVGTHDVAADGQRGPGREPDRHPAVRLCPRTGGSRDRLPAAVRTRRQAAHARRGRRRAVRVGADRFT